MFTKKTIQQRSRPRFGARTLLAVLIAGAVQPNFAATANSPTFDSTEQAVEALYTAVKNDDQAAISGIIGPLASSADITRDKTDREQFVRKYSEMHRLVKNADGTTMLCIGAENWPFPVPLVSSNGKWRFDLDAGAQEIVFRRIGDNEETAIETSRAIAQALIHANAKTDDDAVNQYVQKVVAIPNPTESFHEYYFRLLRTSTGTVVVGYPSQYGSTGVMTLAATPDGAVYEKDLGPKSGQLVHSMMEYKPDRTWYVAEQ